MRGDHPTRERVLELLDVNTETGEIRWRRGQGRMAAGSLAGHVNSLGYRRLTIDRQSLLGHQIVYFIATGDWPDRIDHINGIRNDNRIANLRLCDAGSNARNRTNWRHSKLLGAHRMPETGRYLATIRADDIAYNLGVYATEEEAHARYVLARDLVAEAERKARHEVLEELAATTPKRVEMAERQAA